MAAKMMLGEAVLVPLRGMAPDGEMVYHSVIMRKKDVLLNNGMKTLKSSKNRSTVGMISSKGGRVVYESVLDPPVDVPAPPGRAGAVPCFSR